MDNEENERLLDIIESYGNEYDYYIAIYLQHLRHAGYKQNEQFERSGLPVKVLKGEADTWSLKLHDGLDIPKEKCNIIYEYLEYLSASEYEIRLYSPW